MRMYSQHFLAWLTFKNGLLILILSDLHLKSYHLSRFLRLYKKSQKFAYCLLSVFITDVEKLMTKFLIAILLVIIGLKLKAESGAFVSKYNIVTFTIEDEEAKYEKEENGSSKNDNNDKFDAYYLHYIFCITSRQLPTLLRFYQPYFGFIDQPNTPPPDLT